MSTTPHIPTLKEVQLMKRLLRNFITGYDARTVVEVTTACIYLQTLEQIKENDNIQSDKYDYQIFECPNEIV
jgi:hypothetical protein